MLPHSTATEAMLELESKHGSCSADSVNVLHLSDNELRDFFAGASEDMLAVLKGSLHNSSKEVSLLLVDFAPQVWWCKPLSHVQAKRL